MAPVYEGKAPVRAALFLHPDRSSVTQPARINCHRLAAGSDREMRRTLSPFNQSHLTRISTESGAESELRSSTWLIYTITRTDPPPPSVGLRCRADPSG